MSNIDSGGDAVITTDIEGRVTSLNNVAEFLTGWTQSEAASQSVESVFRIVNPETRTAVESPTVRALRDGVNSGLKNHTLLIAKDGKERAIGPVDHSATPIRDQQGELTGVVLVFRDTTYLQAQEQKIRTALAYANSIIATLGEPFLVLDHAFQIKTANQSFYNTFHLEKTETEGRLIFELGGGQWDVSQLRKLLEDVVSDSNPVRDFSMAIDFPAIGRKIMLLNARRFRSEEGHLNLILLAVQDITERKQAENLLQSIQQLQRFILDSIPQKIVTTKPDGSVDYFNPQWTEYTGLSFDKIKDFGWKQFIHPDDVDEHVREWSHSTQTGKVYEHESRFRRADGEYRWHVSRGVPMRNEAGQIVMWVGANTDIHEIKEAELALKDSEIRYRRLFETAKDGILILDTNTGRINDANPFMSELLGYAHEQFLGKELWEIGLFSDKPANEAAVKILQESGYIRYDHLPLETNRGVAVEVEIVANAYQEDHQNVIQCNIRDITERSSLEKQLNDQTAAMADLHRRKDEFLAMLSHELRNPLAPITNAVHLLSLQKHEDKLQHKARSIIERQVGQMTRLIDDLLEVSRITTGRIHIKQDRIALNAVVERAVETTRPLMDQSRHKFTVSMSANPIWIFADSARVEQVIINLLTNAAKYTPDRGQVSLTVEQQADEAIIRVQDSGVGISSDLLPHIFELFTQADRSLDRSQGGLGIGLCLVQRLVELHGGKVEVSSTLGQGCEFVVRLPVMLPPVAPPTSSPALADQKKGPSLRILVVDDNVDAADSLGLLLKALGHEVQTTYDGLSAMEKASTFLPNVVLLDIGLPGIDGLEVARRMRQHPELNCVVLVAMTGYGQEEDKRRSIEAGVDYHLVKPANFMQVKEILATALSKVL